MEYKPGKKHTKHYKGDYFMCTQSTPESAFIRSMSQVECYEEWEEPENKFKGKYTLGKIEKEEIDTCYQKRKWPVDFKGGSYYETEDKWIYIFTIAIISENENEYSDYLDELQAVLTLLKKDNSDLTSLSARVKEEKASYTHYYLQLVFPRN